MTHPDIPAEERYLDRLYRRLDSLIAQTRTQLTHAHAQVGGTPQARSERESYIRLYTTKLAAYRAANMGLCFGRLDSTDGSTTYIGRVGLRDADPDMSPLLLDWRSDLSRPFYLATTARPEGVRRRRHIRSIGRRVIDIHDEFLDGAAACAGDGNTGDTSDVAGETALLAALNRARTGHMTDVVATIQREQDLIIRHPHRGVMVVQGGPGTGKTAVALHRAAYLLYTYRDQLERSGVLIIGPNSTFLDYIARVLPSLGESGVVLRTIGSLYPGIEATGSDSQHAEEVKGSLAMLDILARAVRQYQTVPDEPVPVWLDGVRVEITPTMVRTARSRARMSRRPHNRARAVFVDVLLDHITDAYSHHVGTPPEISFGDAADLEVRSSLVDDPDFDAGDGDTEVVTVVMDDGHATALDMDGDDAGHAPANLLSDSDRAAIRSEFAELKAVGELIDQWWPILAPEGVLAEVLSDPRRIAAAAFDYVETDQQALYRADGAAFSAHDVPLLDELAELVGVDPASEDSAVEQAWAEQLRQAEEALEILQGSASHDIEDDLDPEILAAYDVVDAEMLARRHRAEADLTVAERAAGDRLWAFGHVIVDEAQELSPMAWRMVMRRSPNRWMTLVGDIAQTSSPAGVDRWGEAIAPYVENRWELCELTVNYRTPGTISAVANRLLAAIDPDISPPTSIRDGEHPVAWHPVAAPATLRQAIMEIVRGLPADRATAIITARGHARAYVRGDDADVLSTPAGSPSDAPRMVRVMDIAEAKGLEFDHVIIVEPAEYLRESIQGVQDLYVAMTRATQQLHVVYAAALPDVVRTTAGDVIPTS